VLKEQTCRYNILYLMVGQGAAMATGQVLNYTEARRNLKSLMDSVIEDRTAVTITRITSEPVIMMAEWTPPRMMEIANTVTMQRPMSLVFI